MSQYWQTIALAGEPDHHLERYCDSCWEGSYGHRVSATHALLREEAPGVLADCGWFGCKIHTYSWVHRGGKTKPMQEFREDLLVAEAELALANEPDDRQWSSKDPRRWVADTLVVPWNGMRDWTRLLRAPYALGGNLRGKDLEGYAQFLLGRDFNREHQATAPSFKPRDETLAPTRETRWESDNQYLARFGVAYRKNLRLVP